MKGTKPKHANGQVTFNVNNLSTSYRKQEHWIDNMKIIHMTWLEQINGGYPFLHELAKSPMSSTHLLIKFELVGPQPSWVLRG